VTTAIVTMAGFGQRFRDAGYEVPKYRIVVHGRTLFAWSMLSLRSFWQDQSTFVFVARRADDAADFIRSEASALGIAAPCVVELDAPTDGQATTALHAGEAVRDRSAPILIYNLATFVHPRWLDRRSVRGDGWTPCFPGAGDGWSFALADASGRVSLLREKQRISDDATVGLYWFSSFDLYAETYAQHYARPENLEKSERYVAPIYNSLIAAGRPVFLERIPLDAVIPLGTPADVEAFARREPPCVE
jgi:hypothetical protein